MISSSGTVLMYLQHPSEHLLPSELEDYLRTINVTFSSLGNLEMKARLTTYVTGAQYTDSGLWRHQNQKPQVEICSLQS